MPKDTPPPIPGEVLRKLEFGGKRNANFTPLEEGKMRLPPRPLGMNSEVGGGQNEEDTRAQKKNVKTVYEAAPAVRDLRKEAVSKFVPNVVRQKIDARTGKNGRLLEPEELERLDAEGYGEEGLTDGLPKGQDDGGNSAEDDAARVLRELEEEERKFMLEVEEGVSKDRLQAGPRRVQIEEVADESL
jgi:hypothetical protein